MRITNKIIQNNELSNMNTNKIYRDKLSSQMSTQKKINRPSDDPVAAIRSLRLRSDVTEITQYYSKNIPDASSWLEVTEGALNSLSQVITNMIDQYTKGASGQLATSDRQILQEELKKLAEEVYATADADYAGRFVFTGYRTDTSLSFTGDETKLYSITEQLDNTAIDTVTVVDTYGTDAGGNKVSLMDMNAGNYSSIPVEETDISSYEVHRLRLAYQDGDDTPPPTLRFGKDADGAFSDSITAVMIHSYNDPYSQVGDTPPEQPLIYVPETGELLMSEAVYSQLMTIKDDLSTSGVNESEIRVTYEKSAWKKGDLRPEHYFYAESGSVEYNASYLDDYGLAGSGETRQVIEYDVGFNQTIRINTRADEAFQPGIGREVEELMGALDSLSSLEQLSADLEELLQKADTGTAGGIQDRLDAVNKALVFQQDKVQKMFEGGITSMQRYLDATSLALTNCGTRGSKLELIENRTKTQKTTFETLKSTNEDIDVTEVAIQLTSAEFTYEAALMASGKILQASLLNYI
ncbi:MAG: hypothetical protein LBQ15_04925 [Clostridium sp.]|jgi:flagellar hook-associated protein 3 FlgL|nr:hypothetical protein [Clostridium sp.]